MQHEAVQHGEVVHAVGSLHDRALALDVLVEGPSVAALSTDVVPAVLEAFFLPRPAFMFATWLTALVLSFIFLNEVSFTAILDTALAILSFTSSCESSLNFCSVACSASFAAVSLMASSVKESGHSASMRLCSFSRCHMWFAGMSPVLFKVILYGCPQ